MKILCIYQFFTSGNRPGSLRPYRLCRLLAEKGHEVVVLATDFNFSSGESEGPALEVIRTVNKPLTIFRIPSSKKYRKNLFYRLYNYLEFSLRALLKGLPMSRGANIILSSIQPIFVGPVGWLFARTRGVPFFLEVRDIWPDALEVKGALKNRVLLGIMYKLATFLYQNACYIISLTPGIADELKRKGLPQEKIDVLPNGVDPVLFPRVNNGREKMRRSLGWDGNFVAVYIGVHTEVTSMDTIVEAAEHLRNKSHIRFEIYGKGSTTPLIKQMIVEKGLHNCRLNGTVPKEDVPNILAASDACLMCLFETPLMHIYFQNKFFDYMGAGKPIVAALRGQQRTIMDENGTGICVDPKDSKGLADAILTLASDPELCRQMGLKGRDYAMKHYCLDDLLERYVKLLTQYASGV